LIIGCIHSRQNLYGHRGKHGSADDKICLEHYTKRAGTYDALQAVPVVKRLADEELARGFNHRRF
jgi:hypothetical protein